MTQLLPDFGNLAFTLAAFVVALSVIVAIHEYGHYIVGRWCGIAAEVFSLGFGPVIFSRKDRRGTRWQVAALPFGGYVKFLGDANATSVGGATEGPSGRNTMLGAPLWARAATVAAGPLFNFALSVIVFAVLIGVQGETTEPLTVRELRPLPAAITQDLAPGDAILAIDGQPAPAYAAFDSFARGLNGTATLPYLVRRDGAEITVMGPHPYAPLVRSVTPGSAAHDAGIVTGDVILAIDGQAIASFDMMVATVSAGNGSPLDLLLWRDGAEMSVTLSPRRVDLPLPEGGFETRWLMGVGGGLVFEPMTVAFGPLAAIGLALDQVWFIIASSVSGLYHMLAGSISSCNLSGPIGIAQTSGAMASQGALEFVWFVAILSTAVGLLNLFPIPVLDGGHLVFFAWEAVTGKAPGDRALRVLTALGLALILTMTALALANDLFLCP